MDRVFVEVVLDAARMSEARFEGRDEIEDPLTEALENSGYGQVTGGGGGAGVAIIDVELVGGERRDEALQFLCQKLRELGAPGGTVLRVRGRDPIDVRL